MKAIAWLLIGFVMGYVFAHYHLSPLTRLWLAGVGVVFAAVAIYASRERRR